MTKEELNRLTMDFITAGAALLESGELNPGEAAAVRGGIAAARQVAAAPPNDWASHIKGGQWFVIDEAAPLPNDWAAAQLPTGDKDDE